MGSPKDSTSNQKDAMISDRRRICAGSSGGGGLVFGFVIAANSGAPSSLFISRSLLLTPFVSRLSVVPVAPIVALNSFPSVGVTSPSIRFLTVDSDMIVCHMYS
jgi:hypothetical protein